MPTLLLKQNKNNWYATTCDTHHFVQFQHKPLLNLPKTFGKKTQATKNT